MAHTVGVINATQISLYVFDTTWKKVAHATDGEISFTTDNRDITSKDSSGFRQIADGLKSWSISSNHFLAWDAAYGFTDIYADWAAGSSFSVKFGSVVTDDHNYEGTVRIESMSMGGGVEDNATFSISLAGHGSLTENTHPTS